MASNYDGEMGIFEDYQGPDNPGFAGTVQHHWRGASGEFYSAYYDSDFALWAMEGWGDVSTLDDLKARYN